MDSFYDNNVCDTIAFSMRIVHVETYRRSINKDIDTLRNIAKYVVMILGLATAVFFSALVFVGGITTSILMPAIAYAILGIAFKKYAFKEGSSGHIGVMLALLTAIVTFQWGLVDAANDLRDFSKVARITEKEKSESRLVVLMRNFQRGLLLRDPINAQIEFVPWDQIKSFSRPSWRYKNFRNFACDIFEWRCAQVMYP